MRERGFTLLELLVAMTLMGLVGVMAAGGLGFGVAAWERSERIGEAAVETRVVQKLLRAVLAEARPVVRRDGTRTPPVVFEGGPQRLRLIAPLPARLAPAADLYLEIGMRPGRGGLALSLRWTGIGERAPDLSRGAVEERLIDGATALRFRYWGADVETGKGRWHARWQGRERLPALVGIALERPGADWPPFVARVGP